MSDDAMHGTPPSVHSSTPPPSSAQSGSAIADFRLGQLVRRRDPASIHLATVSPGSARPSTTQGQQVLMAVVDREVSAQPATRTTFARSIELASRIGHPGIARIVGHGLWHEHLWVATAPVPATDVAQLIERHPDGTDVELAVRIVRAAGEALDAAHRSGLVHGGLTAADLLLSADALGPAGGRSTGETGITVAGFGLTPPSGDGAPAHPSVDVSALGRILVTLLTGTTSVARHRVSGAVSPAFYAVLARALDPAPEHAYRTCAEFVRAADLALHLTHTDGEPATEVLGSQTPTVPHDGPRMFIPAPARKRPAGGTGIRRPWFPGTTAAHHVSRSRRVHHAPAGAAGPGPGRRSRWWVSSMVVAAVVGTVVGALALVGARHAPTPWPADVAPIADAFPRLVAASPEDTGWRESLCATVSSDGLDGITCTDTDGVTYVLWHTPTSEAREAVTGRLKGYPGNAIRWRDGPASASRDSVADGWVVTSFSAPHHAPYTLVTTWPQHTGREILDIWWRAAPLG